jgi:hypothetical protein
MHFLYNIAPPHLDFLCGNDEKVATSRLVRQSSSRHLGDRLNLYIRGNPSKEQGMLDVVLLAGGIGFFIISIAYAYGCDRL